MPIRKINKTAYKPKQWLRCYLDLYNPKTFFNKTASTFAAGYKCRNSQSAATLGHHIFKVWQVEILSWLNEYGLSETELKSRLMMCIDAVDPKGYPLWTVRLRALELAGKWIGMEKMSVSNNFDSSNNVTFTVTNNPAPQITAETSPCEAAEIYNRKVRDLNNSYFGRK